MQLAIAIFPLIFLHSMFLKAIAAGTQLSDSHSLFPPGLNDLNDRLLNLTSPENPYISPLNPAVVSNYGSYASCTIPGLDTRLDYTLGSTLPQKGLLNILFVARRQTEIQINTGYRDKRINPPEGIYRYDLGGISFLAADKRGLKWSDLLEAIILVGYCGVGQKVFREVEAKVYAGNTWIGNVDVEKVEDLTPE